MTVEWKCSQRITANTTNVDFTEVNDVLGEWNGTQFTPKYPGKYLVTGSIFLTSSTAVTVTAYLDGTSDKRLNQIVTDTIHHFSGAIRLSAGEVLSLRLNSGVTLSNDSAFHWIDITRID